MKSVCLIIFGARHTSVNCACAFFSLHQRSDYFLSFTFFPIRWDFSFLGSMGRWFPLRYLPPPPVATYVFLHGILIYHLCGYWFIFLVFCFLFGIFWLFFFSSKVPTFSTEVCELRWLSVCESLSPCHDERILPVSSMDTALHWRA